MIAIASDHGGYDLKERVKKYLEENNIPFQDFGCDSKASCDSDYAHNRSPAVFLLFLHYIFISKHLDLIFIVYFKFHTASALS